MATGCLSFFTSNHSAHAKQWLQKGSQYTLVCVACLVEIIENKNEPSIKKTKTLQELLKLISNSALLKLLKENENVLSHLLKCLWDLMDYEEGKLTQNITVVEIVFQLCCALNLEQFVEKVVEKLTTKLISTENVKKVWLQLDLLGKIIQNIPSLTGNLVKGRTNLISCLGKWTSYPDEDTRSSLFFILTHFYRHPQYCEEISWEITDLVFRECCEVLTTATSKELQINSIALLQSLTAKENSGSTSKAIRCYMDLVITCLKKAFLSTVDLVLTIAIGCLSNLVEFDENIIKTDLPGFVFEVFHSKDDTLLSLGLKSIARFLDNTLMYTRGHVVYGFDAMLSALLVATDSKNMKVLRQGFEILRNIFEKCPQELVLISSQDVLKKCLDVITKGLSIGDDHVILQATSCLGVVLTRRHYSCDVPYGQLGELVELVVRRLEKVCHISGHWNRVENKDLKSSTIAAVLEVINKSVDLVIFGRSKPPSIEVLLASTNESILLELEEFFNILLKLCDQICIPNVISNLRNLDDTTVPETFFKVLSKLLQTCSADGNEVAKKFVSSCFIRIALETKAQHISSTSVQDAINAFLQTMCCCLFSSDMREIAGNVLSSSLQQVNGTAQELLQILKQKNAQDEALKRTQECLLLLFHLAYINGDRLAPRAQLLHALSTFLVLNPTCFCDSSTVIPRCLTQLFLRELYQTKLDSSPIYFEAQRILADGLLRNMESMSVLYFHDIALLEWSVTFQELDPSLRKEIMELWFSHGSEADDKEQEMTFWKRMVNDDSGRLLMLVSILSSVDVNAQNSLLEVIQHVLQFSNIQIVKQVLQQLKQAVQKLFLNQAVDPLSNQSMESILQLLCLLVTTCVAEPLDEDFNKLIYHVVNFLTHHANSSGLHVKCLNFLNACVIQDAKHASEKVLLFLLNHQEYNSFLEKVIHTYQCSTQLECTQQTLTLATVLVSISQMLHLQNTFDISAKNVISVRVEAVLPLLTYCSNPLLQMAANVFWQSVLKSLESRKLCDSNLVLISKENTEQCGASSSAESLTTSQEGTSERKLTKVHLQMILIYLQNSLFHVNMLVKLTALRCLEALLSLEDHVGHLIQNPWNTSVLRECKDFSTPSSLGFTMTLYSLFLQHKRLKSLRIEVPVKELIKAVLERSDCDESLKENAVSDLYLSALPRFFSEVVQCGLMTDAEKSTLKNYVKCLVEIFQTDKDREHERRFVCLQEMLVHDEIIQGKMNILNSLHDLQLKLD